MLLKVLLVIEQLQAAADLYMVFGILEVTYEMNLFQSLFNHSFPENRFVRFSYFCMKLGLLAI